MSTLWRVLSLLSLPGKRLRVAAEPVSQRGTLANKDARVAHL